MCRNVFVREFESQSDSVFRTGLPLRANERRRESVCVCECDERYIARDVVAGAKVSEAVQGKRHERLHCQGLSLSRSLSLALSLTLCMSFFFSNTKIHRWRKKGNIERQSEHRERKRKRKRKRTKDERCIHTHTSRASA